MPRTFNCYFKQRLASLLQPLKSANLSFLSEVTLIPSCRRIAVKRRRLGAAVARRGLYRSHDEKCLGHAGTAA